MILNSTRENSCPQRQTQQHALSIRSRPSHSMAALRQGLGKVSFPDPYDLHFSIVIDDAYSGIKVIDGQPSMMEAGYQNFFLIKTNRYENALPAEVKVRIPLEPPSGMSRQEFARKIIDRSQKFSSYVAPYSFPKNVRESKMRSGEYNSSSYVAGLLRSVMGYVPLISTPGYQSPG